MASVFFSYCHADEALRDQLEIQLAALKRQGVIETWHDRRIGAGEEFAKAIDHHVNEDDIIVLLVSPNFIASDYCYDIELKRAMERHEAGEAIVIPVILRPCDWHDTPFGKLNATPRDGIPVTKFANQDEALLEVAKSVRAAAERLGTKVARAHATAPMPRLETKSATLPRSSNLALDKHFSDRDRDEFKHATFEYMARFFEGSLNELQNRNPGIEGSFRRVDANRFTGVIYKGGQAISRCTVFMGDGSFGNGIGFVEGETSASNSYNELLTVQNDRQSLYMTSLGFSIGGSRDEKLTQEGAAELYWGRLVGRLQSR